MEKEINCELPPIFKLSLLSCILPYFGYLHMWRRLLTQINKETEEIWEDNTEALVYMGKNFKKEKDLHTYRNLKSIRRSFIDLYSLVISNSELNSLSFMEHFSSLIKKLNKNEVIICDTHKSNIYKYSICFCKKENIHLILPAVLCSSFTVEEVAFNDEKSLLNSMKTANRYLSNSILRIENKEDWNINTKTLIDDMIERCQIKNCNCRPTKLQANIDNNVENIKSIIDQSYIQIINDVQFDIKISSNSSKTIINDIFESFPKARLNLDIEFDEIRSKFLHKGTLCTLIIDGNICSFKFNSISKTMKKIEIQGCEIIEAECKGIFAIRIAKLILNNITLVDSNLYSQEEIKFHNEIKVVTKLQKSAFIISDRKHLSLDSNLKTIENDRIFLEYCSKACIFLNRGYENKEVFEKLDQFPKNIDYTFELDLYSSDSNSLKLLNDSCFIKMINRLKGKIQCLGLAIKTKKLNTKEISILGQRIIEKINNNHKCFNVDKD